MGRKRGGVVDKYKRAFMKTVIIYKESLLNPSETFVAEQARALQRFHPQYVGLTRTDPCLAFDGEPIYLTLRKGRLARWRTGLFRRIPVAPLFHRRIQRLRAALIHAHFASDGLQVADLARKLKVPLIVTLHGADVTVRQNFAPRYNKLWTQASLFICVSEFIRRKALEAGFPPEKCRVHHIGIDLEKFRQPTSPRDQKLILFVGRLVEKKGCEVLIRAMEAVRADVPDASLAIIGNGPLRPALTTLAAGLGVPCQFLGPQPPEVVQSWLRQASIFCAPSQEAANGDSEGLGMVFLEAQACGVPVVSTLHGGIPEAVKNGETGLLVPERDPQALAQALLTYLKDPALVVRHGVAGRPWVALDFDLFKQTKLLEGIYDEVLL
jgi:glycosyltransferase involved in cell wall biosynthesis